MHVEEIEYEVDGLRMIGHLATDDTRSGKRPAVLVCHEGPGLDDHAKRRAEQLAEIGYVAFMLDYHGVGVPVPLDQMMERLMPLMSDPERVRRLGKGGLDVLLADPTPTQSASRRSATASGARWRSSSARGGADLKAVVGFHSGLQTTAPRMRRTSRAACSCASAPRIRSSLPTSARRSRRRCALPASTGA